MRLIVTRPAEDTEELSRALRKLGCEPLAAPVMTIVFRPDADLPAERYAAIAITSANGVRALARHPRRGRLDRTMVYAVGPASAAAAHAAGFGPVTECGGDVAGLIEAIRATGDPAAGPVLYPSGVQTTGDLEAELGKSGFDVHRVVLYEARPLSRLPGPVIAAIATGDVAGVLLYSPRTARLWADLLHRHGVLASARKLTHFCLSRNVGKAVAETIGEEAPVLVPDRPDEAAMLASIARRIRRN